MARLEAATQQEDTDSQANLSQDDLHSVENNIRSTKELAGEIEGMRRNLVNRVQQDGEGAISQLEAHKFVREAKGLKSTGELKKLESQFAEHLFAQRKLMERAGEMLGGKKELLNEGEREEIMAKFPNMSLKQKENELRRIEEMMQTREKRLNETGSLDEQIREGLNSKLKSADDYKGRLKAIEEANETNERFEKYKRLWETDKIAEKTKVEYFEWFLSLSGSEQKHAIDKARAEDIEPRTALYDLHEQLPSKYRNNQFGRLGKTDRVKYLGTVEREITNDYMKLAWSKNTDMSTQSKAFAINSFKQQKGKNHKVEGLDRILEKHQSLEMFPGHAEAEAQLRTQIEKFSPELVSPHMEEFNRSSFEGKTKIIDKVAKLEEREQGVQKTFNKFEPEIKKHFEDDFANSNDTESKVKILKQMELFKVERGKYMKLWKKNEQHFKSNFAIYEAWYNEHITSLEKARKANTDLSIMIRKRKKTNTSFEKLDPRLQKRCPNWNDLGTKEKEQMLKKLTKAQKILKAVDTLKKTVKSLEKSGMEDKALEVLKSAYELDPEDPEIQKDLNRIAKKLGKETEVEELKAETKKNEETEATEEEVDEDVDGEELLETVFGESANIDFTEDEIDNIQRSEETFEMVEDNVETLGGNLQEDSETRARKDYKGETELESEIIDEVTNKDRIIDRDGEAQNVIHVDFENREDLKDVQNQILTPRKRDVDRGVTHVEMKDKQTGQIVELDKAKEKLGAQKDAIIQNRAQGLLSRLDNKNANLSDKQKAALKESLEEQAEEELKRRTQAQKIYKQNAA